MDDQDSGSTKSRLAAEPDAISESTIAIAQRPVASLWQIAGWADFEATALPCLAFCGLSMPGDCRTITRADRLRAFRVAPEKILIENAPDLSHFAGDALAVLDLSHARTAITLSGSRVRDLLSQLTSVDVRPIALPPERFVQTGMHGVGVILVCQSRDAFDILVPTTWAASLFEWIQVNAAPYGGGVRGQARG